MAIGGIGSYNNYYNYQNTISQMRLQQALSKNTRYQQSVNAVQGASSVSNSFTSDSIDFLRTYTSTMSDVMSSANALRSANQSGVMKDLSVSSSNTDVASVSKKYMLRDEANISLDVTQTALAQQNVSAGIQGSAQAAQDMNFTIAGQNGSVNVQINRMNDDGSMKTNRDMLKEAAKQINAGDAGVTASVIEKDGVTSLKLAGGSTGSGAAFSVSGDLGAASGADQVSQAAQDAKYSVTIDKVTKEYTSQSNNITLETGKIGAVLKGAGKTEISVAPDSEKIASAVTDLIDSYNNALTFLSSNKSHGTGVSTQLNGMSKNLLSKEAMDVLGISKNKDGTLSVDKSKLKESLTSDSKFTKDLINGSFGLAQTAYNRASSAMRTNSASLVSYDLQEIDQASYNDPINFMNMYSKNGAYNMGNYTALGLMMNYLV